MDATIVVWIGAATAALCSIAWLLYRFARWARKGGSGAYALGAAFALFGIGAVPDPAFENVQVAKQHKKKREDDSGDPPSSNDTGD